MSTSAARPPWHSAHLRELYPIPACTRGSRSYLVMLPNDYNYPGFPAWIVRFGMSPAVSESSGCSPTQLKIIHENLQRNTECSKCIVIRYHTRFVCRKKQNIGPSAQFRGAHAPDGTPSQDEYQSYLCGKASSRFLLARYACHQHVPIPSRRAGVASQAKKLNH